MFSGPMSDPTGAVGRLQSDISRIDNEVRRKANDHEVSTLNSNVADLSRSIGEASSVCYGLCSRIETLEAQMQRMVEEHPQE